MHGKSTPISCWRHHAGFTLVEIMVAGLISSAVAIALAALTITGCRMERSIFYQQASLKEAQSAIEGLNREIRLATTPLRVVDDSGNAVPQGNCVLFSRLGEPPNQQSIRLVSTDQKMMTPWDNTLVYDPNRTVGGDEVVLARWVTPLATAGAFQYSGATTPLVVWMRVGDPVGGDLKAANVVSGPGIQGVEINITVAPRN